MNFTQTLYALEVNYFNVKLLILCLNFFKRFPQWFYLNKFMDGTLNVLAIASTYICPRRPKSRQAESLPRQVQLYWREK